MRQSLSLPHPKIKYLTRTTLSADTKEFVESMLQLDPLQRPTIAELLNHERFKLKGKSMSFGIESLVYWFHYLGFILFGIAMD